MVIGSGLLAKAFSQSYEMCEDICVYAAGVSNSSCVDEKEFSRERQRLENSLKRALEANVFVYFGTCSIVDPETKNTPYVRHKLVMEEIVSSHPGYLILRLPQVAGRTPNPHTLLNFLYARISRSESFNLWRYATRNVIDIDDVVSIAHQIIKSDCFKNQALNIANKKSYPMIDIVDTMEKVIGKKAIYNLLDQGATYSIDISNVIEYCEKAGVVFDDMYLERVISKYYLGV